MSDPTSSEAAARRFPAWAERVLLVVCAPLLFLLTSEVLIALLDVDTELARNEGAQIALPVWLLADEGWVADRRTRARRTEGEPIAAEDVAWLYHFEEARYIQYKLKPNVDAEAANPFAPNEVERGITFRIRSNEHGFRTPPWGPKEPGRVRIVTIGDSSTFGWGVDAEHTYQGLLADRLEAVAPGRFEIVNLGIPGHNTEHGVEMTRHWALALEPDLLIVSYGANDPRMVPNPTADVVAADYGWRGALRHRLLDLGTYRLLRKVLLSTVDPLDRPTSDEIEGRHKVEAVAPEHYRENLREIFTRAGEVGARTLFVSICTSDPRYEGGMRTTARELDAGYLDVRALFTARVDALEAGELMPEQVSHYRRIYGREAMRVQRSLYLTSDGCHPHRVGNTLIAEQLEGLVLAALGMPTRPSSHGDSP